MNAADVILKFKNANESFRNLYPITFKDHLSTFQPCIEVIMQRESCNALEAFVIASDTIPEIKQSHFIILIYMACVWEIYSRQVESNAPMTGQPQAAPVHHIVGHEPEKGTK